MRRNSDRTRAAAGLAVALGLTLLLGGCYENRIQWSPDGGTMAVITSEGLFLADSEGRLSKLLLPGVKAVAWLSDSQRLAVAMGEGSRRNSLAVARLDGGKVTVGEPLYAGGDVVDVRVAPGDRHVAFTTESESWFHLRVAPIDGSAPSIVIAEYVAAYPDWSADGRSLAYFQASGGPSLDDEDATRLGALVSRVVVDERGGIERASKPNHLAGVLFSGFSRVRCLRDGGTVFSAVELSLPFATEDEEVGDHNQQLFAFDPSRQATLVRLIPRKREWEGQLDFFEVSPDERQVAFGTLTGEVRVFTLATGRVQAVQSTATKKMQGAPVWRRAGELTYLKRTPEEGELATQRPAEVVLRTAHEESVLSADWSDEFMKQLAEPE